MTIARYVAGPLLCLALAGSPVMPVMAADVAGGPRASAASIGSGAAEVLKVGPRRAVKTLAEAARMALAGSTIEVDAGIYSGDVAVWERDGISVRAVGGRVRLLAAGAAAEGKAIWVVRATGMSVEGFDFSGATVADRNGAGIRLERGSLRVTACSFTDNETGLLTGNDPTIELDISNSEFARNGAGDGQSHNLYVGSIARLSVTGSYSHDAVVGHLLKSRAALNVIVGNRLTDEGGRASYELEFPNGGIAYVVGNRIQQSMRSENPVMLSYGAEGYRGPIHELHVVDNVFVDDMAAPGIFVRASPGNATVRIVGNVLVGAGRFEAGSQAVLRDNVTRGRAERDAALRRTR